VDFKIEFGRLHGPDDDDVQIILADEISPDSCRLWDAITNEVLDKDRFRRDMGQVKESYQEVARRLGVLPDGVVLGRMDPVISPDEEPETP
jgi:phosphoribosylaminoimidazole-succinocarboxamide synthase